MKRLAIAVLVLVVLAAVAYSAEKTLGEYKAVYEREVAKINADDGKRKAANAAYLNALDRVKAIATRKADLDTVKAVIAEKKRFEDFGNLTDEMPNKQPRAIVQAQAGYSEALAHAQADKDSRVLKLSRKYVAALRKSITSLIEAEKMEEASEFDAEVKRVEFIIGDIESRMSEPDKKRPRPKLEPPRQAPIMGLKKGLVLHCDFDRNEHGMVTDKSGKGNHGKVHGATRVMNARGMGNGAYQFDGRDDYIECEHDASLVTVLALSAQAWIRKTDVDFNVVMGKYDTGGNNRGWQISFSDGSRGPGGTLTLSVSPDGRLTSICSTHGSQIVDSAWHHVAAVYDGTRTKLYLDGKLNASSRYTNRINDGGEPFLIGAVAIDNVPSRHFHGLIDEVMIWNRPLSDSEVKELYKLQGGK